MAIALPLAIPVTSTTTSAAVEVASAPRSELMGCLPFLRDEVAKRNNWVRPFSSFYVKHYGLPRGADPELLDDSFDSPWYTEAFYMPELSWETVTVAQGPGQDSYDVEDADAWEFGSWSAPSVFTYCERPVQVRVNTIARQGAGAGVIVLRTDDLCETYNSKTKTCTLIMGDKEYNLKDKTVRDSLRCRNVSWVPNGSVPVQIVSRDQPDHTDPEARISDNSWRDFAGDGDKFVWAGDYRKDWCIPVPKKAGKYPLTVVVSVDAETDRGTGQRYWYCYWSFNTIRCGNYMDRDRTIQDDREYSYGVTVTANSVVLKKVKHFR